MLARLMFKILKAKLQQYVSQELPDVQARFRIYIYIYTYVCVNIYMYECMLSCFSHVWLCEIPWSAALQVPLSMGFSRQECWSGLPFPSPGDLPNSGIEPGSFKSPSLADRFFTTRATWKTHLYIRKHICVCVCECMHKYINFFLTIMTCNYFLLDILYLKISKPVVTK